jgi:hypothetical protein
MKKQETEAFSSMVASLMADADKEMVLADSTYRITETFNQ